jgi:uncharacterized protein (DUF1499 family)
VPPTPLAHPSCLLFLALLVGACGADSGEAPSPPALTEKGQLSPCPDSPNCVSSQASDDTHRVEPLPLPPDPELAMERALGSLERVTIREKRPGYRWATVESRIFRFVDDVELLAGPGATRIEVRSASRTGYGDMGVNRERVQQLRNFLDSKAQ